jgi:hypothetical protein
MPAVKARELRKMVEAIGEEKVYEHVAANFREKRLKPEDFSIRDLFEELVPDGRELVRSFSPRKGGGFVNLTEAGDAVNSAAFSNITGQIFYNKILESYAQEEFVFSRIVPTVPTDLNGEKMPGIGELGDQAQVVGEGQAYPLAGTNEDWIETPQTTKRGFIVAATKEAIFFDRTNLLLRRCGEVGKSLGLNKEKRIIDCVVDENSTAHRYKWRDTTYATYQTTSPWDNVAASNALVDWTDIDAAEQTFAGILDPNTGEPIIVTGNTIITVPALRATVARILNATNVSLQAGGFATSGDLFRTDSPSPIGAHEFSIGGYKWAGSRQLAARMATDTSWFLGDPAGAFAYMENWPVTVTTAPSNSEAEFTQDIVVRYKASERGAATTIDPRLMVKCTVA